MTEFLPQTIVIFGDRLHEVDLQHQLHDELGLPVLVLSEAIEVISALRYESASQVAGLVVMEAPERISCQKTVMINAMRADVPTVVMTGDPKGTELLKPVMGYEGVTVLSQLNTAPEATANITNFFSLALHPAS